MGCPIYVELDKIDIGSLRMFIESDFYFMARQFAFLVGFGGIIVFAERTLSNRSLLQLYGFLELRTAVFLGNEGRTQKGS